MKLNSQIATQHIGKEQVDILLPSAEAVGEGPEEWSSGRLFCFLK